MTRAKVSCVPKILFLVSTMKIYLYTRHCSYIYFTVSWTTLIFYFFFGNFFGNTQETYQGHPKWRTLLHAISVDAGKPLELRLYKIDEYGGVSHVGRKPLIGNNSNVIESFINQQNFVAGFDYFICVYEVEIGFKEVAKSSRIKCIDTTQILRERQHQFEIRRQQALASAAAHQAAAQKAAYVRSLAQAQKYHTFIQQQRELAERQKEEALIARIHARSTAKLDSADYVKEHVSRGAATAIDNVFNQIDT